MVAFVANIAMDPHHIGQRPVQLPLAVASVAREPVAYIEPRFDVFTILGRACAYRLSELGRGLPWYKKRDGLVSVNTLPRLPSVLLEPWVTSPCHAIAAAWLNHVLEHPLALVVTHPRQWPMARRVPAETLVYDCFDNWTEITKRSSSRQRWIAKQEQQLAEQADIVLVSAEGLRAKMLQYNRNVHLVRNAVNIEMFDHVTHVSDEIAAYPAPRIGFVGSIEHWIDTALLDALGDAFPNGSVIAVGPNRIGAKARSPRVHYVGRRPYSQVPAIIRALDVCIIPFRITELTQDVDPLKIYEYFALGKPVVATPMPEVARHGELVRLAEGPAGFIRQVECGLAEPADATVRQSRIECARANSWHARAKQVIDLLASSRSTNK